MVLCVLDINAWRCYGEVFNFEFFPLISRRDEESSKMQKSLAWWAVAVIYFAILAFLGKQKHKEVKEDSPLIRTESGEILQNNTTVACDRDKTVNIWCHQLFYTFPPAIKKYQIFNNNYSDEDKTVNIWCHQLFCLSEYMNIRASSA